MTSDHPPPFIVIKIDQQQFRLEPREYTPRELLTLAGDNPNETTLAEKHGHDITKYINLDEPIEVRNGQHFIVYHNGPVPVS